MKTTNAAIEQLGFTHPENPGWKHISFCAFCGPVSKTDEGLRGKPVGGYKLRDTWGA